MAKNSLGNFMQTTTGFVLRNYRIIVQNDSLLPVERLYNGTLSVAYKNPLSAFFYNLSASYSAIRNSITYDQFYDGLFLTTRALLIPSKQKSLILSSQVNKYFINSKINLSFFINHQWNRSVQRQQGEQVHINTNSTALTSKINIPLFDFLTVDNEASIKNFMNSIERINSTTLEFSVARFQNNLKLLLPLHKKVELFSNTEYYGFWNNSSANKSYLFTDLGLMYKDKKLDIEIGFHNITNNKRFEVKTISNNSLLLSQTMLRGRTIMLKTYIKF